jgi:hypothetical protein
MTSRIFAKFRSARWLLASFCLGLALITTGCFSSYGRIKSNDSTSRVFESSQLPANYKFYYYGRSKMPYAIIGLDSQYNLKSRLWREVDPDSEAFEKMVEWTWWDTSYYPNYPRGKDILDPTGKKIGIWYSSARWAAVKMLDDKGTVMIAPDTPWDLGGF